MCDNCSVILEQLNAAIFDFTNLKDLRAWLREHKASGKKG
jgi:hypothetical protein